MSSGVFVGCAPVLYSELLGTVATIKLAEAIHGYARCSGHKLQQSSPGFVAHQIYCLKYNGERSVSYSQDVANAPYLLSTNTSQLCCHWFFVSRTGNYTGWNLSGNILSEWCSWKLATVFPQVIFTNQCEWPTFQKLTMVGWLGP